MTSEPTRPMGGRQRWPLVPSLWSPPYIGVKCGPLPQRNLLQTIAGKRPEQFFSSFPRLQPCTTLAMHPGPPFDLLRSFGCLQLWAAAQFNCPLPPLADHCKTTHSPCQQMRGHPDDGV